MSYQNVGPAWPCNSPATTGTHYVGYVVAKRLVRSNLTVIQSCWDTNSRIIWHGIFFLWIYLNLLCTVMFFYGITVVLKLRSFTGTNSFLIIIFRPKLRYCISTVPYGAAPVKNKKLKKSKSFAFDYFFYIIFLRYRSGQIR